MHGVRKETSNSIEGRIVIIDRYTILKIKETDYLYSP